MSSDLGFDLERPRIHPPLPKDIAGDSTLNEQETIDYLYNTRHIIDDPSRLKPNGHYLLFDNETEYPLLLFAKCNGHFDEKVLFTPIAYTAAEEHITFSFNRWEAISKEQRAKFEISYDSIRDINKSRYHIFGTHHVIQRRIPYLLLSEGLEYPKETTFPTIREKYLMNPEIIKAVSEFMPSNVDVKKKERSPSKSPKSPSKKRRSRSNSPNSHKKHKTARGGRKHHTAKTRKHNK
jgi:hypothetical protein